eukprot:m.691181 g.691181  ORF g.691181 m.691181 type:complete len:113 (+) comp58639_c1_seq3:77-415(+)
MRGLRRADLPAPDSTVRFKKTSGLKTKAPKKDMNRKQKIKVRSQLKQELKQKKAEEQLQMEVRESGSTIKRVGKPAVLRAAGVGSESENGGMDTRSKPGPGTTLGRPTPPIV